MSVQVRKWGNSASVRIPSSVMAAAALSLDQTVDIHVEDGRVVIDPVRSPDATLDALLAAMTPETFPDIVGFGAPVGQELW